MSSNTTMSTGGENHPDESPYAPYALKQQDLPVVGKRQSLISIGCLIFSLVASVVALGSPNWVSFSYKDLAYQVQNSRSVIPLLPRNSKVTLTAGLLAGSVNWKDYPAAFTTCQGGKLLATRQLIFSGACGNGAGLSDNVTCRDGEYSGGVDQCIEYLCKIKFNYTSYTKELSKRIDSRTHSVNTTGLEVDDFCNATGNGGSGSVVAAGNLCDPDRLFFRVGYPGYSTVFLIFLDMTFLIFALIMNILSTRPGHWALQLRIGCCPLAKAGWILATIGFIFSIWPPFNFLMQSSLEKGMPLVINEEGNNIEPVVPSDVSTTQGSDVSLTFGWGLFVYFPIAQIVLFVSAWFARQAWVLHEEQYEAHQDIFLAPPELELETTALKAHR